MTIPELLLHIAQLDERIGTMNAERATLLGQLAIAERAA
jgi:hypothetical protein